MQRVKLDQIDLTILAELRDHGRITNVELSRRVGISAPPCLPPWSVSARPAHTSTRRGA